MNIDYSTYPKGHTLDRKRFVFEEWLRGSFREGLWRGEQLRPVRRSVLIAFTSLHYSDDLDALLRYDAAGIAPLLFIGSPDGYRRSKQKTTRGWEIAVIEARPAGEMLNDVGLLTAGEVVRLGLSMCDTIVAWAERATITRGLCPATVYVAGDQGQRRFTGATPRSFLVLGSEGMNTDFPNHAYDAPSDNAALDATLDDAAFTVAMILWFALLREHPYDVPGHPHQYDNIWNDIRRPFTGPPELGRLLEAVLVADVAKRMKTDEFRVELAKLARAWNVDLPPFPPPGLADS